MRDWQIGDDLLDTGAVDERIEELEEELEEIDPEAYADFFNDTDDDVLEEKYGAMRSTAEGVFEQLLALQDFKIELEDYCEWRYGETLIHEKYFSAYAEQLAEELGTIPPDASWPLNHINWDTAAEDLKQDYHYADIEGSTYYVRCS